MGALQSRHLDARQRKNLSGHTTVMLREFSSHFRRQLCAGILEQQQNDVGLKEPAGTPTLLHQQDSVTGSKVILEGTLQQYLDGKWRRRHLQVTKSFAVESRDSKEVFEGGWERRRDLNLSGCQICTTIQEHRLLVDETCRHIKGRRGGKMPFWDCPTDFPVFIQHPYSAPLCLCAESREAQRLWARHLQRAVQHQSSILQRKDTAESRAFLEAVRFYRQEKGSYQPGVLLMGSEEEVLSSLIMEEILPCLHFRIFPRLIPNQRRLTWIKLQAEVYSQVCAQVRAEMRALMEEVAQQRPLLEKLVRSDLPQITTQQDCIAHRITEDMCEEISQCLSTAVIPLLGPTFQEVAAPICEGFAAARQLFLETCDDVISRGCSGQSLQELLSPLSGLGLGSARASQYLAMLEWSAGGRAWLQASWGIHSSLCRPLVFQAQSTLQQLLDRAALMFRHLLTLKPCLSVDPSQVTAILHRVRDRVLKLDQDLRSVRAQLVLESLLQLSLPALIERLGHLDSSHYQPLVQPHYTPFLHPDIIYHQVLRASLTREIQAVMRDTLPQQCVPLSTGRRSASSENTYEEWSPPGGHSRSCSQLSDSHTLTPGARSYENFEGLMSELEPQQSGGGWDAGRDERGAKGATTLEGGEYICLMGADGGEQWIRASAFKHTPLPAKRTFPVNDCGFGC
ncbi:protein Niban 1-like isoform X2 [Megalops cyprinoides]|uniref:protein Niban 1-like isoform X2 n=1 Tax=Megalops cyprinoides TaxID=118141 RepID=UPI001863E127|nr:protein Niban 1-like isoform X2 [Megalops cyprinoides]